MRILFWSEGFWPLIGGAEIFGANLVSALQKRNHECIVVTSKDLAELPDESEFKGVPIYRFPFHRALSGSEIDQIFSCRKEVEKLKHTFQPDLIHINGVSPSTVFHLQTAAVHPAPVLVRMNNQMASPTRVGPSTLMQNILVNATWVTSVSKAVQNQVRKAIPDIQSRSSVIYTGVAPPDQAPLPLSFNPPVLLCLGRLVHGKGFDLALTALASIVEQFPNIRMIIAGDGPARPELEQQVGELGLGKIVNFLGWVEPSKVCTLLNTATIVLIPSRQEGLPQTGCQAAMMGRPIVATRVSGLPEIVQHNKTGLLINNEDANALKEGIRFLLNNPRVTIQMGKAARIQSTIKFNWENCVESFEAQYKTLVNQLSSPLVAHQLR